MHNHEDQFDLQVRLPTLDVSDDWPMLGQAHDNAHRANEGADWVTVAKRPKRQRAAADGPQPVTKQHRPTINSTNRENAKRQKQPRRQNGIVGKNASSGIPTCKKMKFANIFASRFGPDLEATALKTDLERSLHINIDSCVKLQSKHPDIYSSFNISTKCEDPSIFMKADIWPADCYVHWMRKPQITSDRHEMETANTSVTSTSQPNDR